MAGIVDNIINGTWANPAMQTQGWGQPVENAPPRDGVVNSPYTRQGTSGVKFNLAHGFVPGAIPMRASSPPAWTNNGPALFQIGQELARQPGTRYAVDGSGQRIDPIKLGYGSSSQNPAVTAATQMGQGVAPPFPASVDDRLNARARAAQQAWLTAQAGQPGAAGGGIRPPWTIPQPPKGANPGMGGAIIGDGQMSPGIPPQLPPADGSSPLPVWAGDNTQQQGGQLGINVRGGRQPNVSPSERYSLANMLGQINAQRRQSNATGSTGVYNYRNGVKTGTVNGGSSASAYEAAASKARKGTGATESGVDWW